MNVLLKKVGQPYELVEIENKLKPMQELIGGYIETVSITHKLLIICDEEGIIKNRLNNVTVKTYAGPQTIKGDFFICLNNGEEFAGLPDNADIKKLIDSFHMFDMQPQKEKPASTVIDSER